MSRALRKSNPTLITHIGAYRYTLSAFGVPAAPWPEPRGGGKGSGRGASAEPVDIKVEPGMADGEGGGGSGAWGLSAEASAEDVANEAQCHIAELDDRQPRQR